MKAKKTFKYTPNTVSISDFQRGAGKLVDRIRESTQPYFIMRNNKPEAVILPIEEYEEYQRVKSEAEAVADIHQGMKEYREGKAVLLKSLKDLI